MKQEETNVEKLLKDLKFYTKALQFQSYLVNKVATIIAYKWGNDFSIKELKESFENYRSDKDVKNYLI